MGTVTDYAEAISGELVWLPAPVVGEVQTARPTEFQITMTFTNRECEACQCPASEHPIINIGGCRACVAAGTKFPCTYDALRAVGWTAPDECAGQCR